MKKIVTIGSATQDIFIYTKPGDVPREERNGTAFVLFEEGSKIAVQNLHYATGGGAINAAAALTLLEHTAIPVCKIAYDTAGDFIVNDLKKRGIATDHVCFTSSAPTAISFVLPSPTGNRAILAHRGANGTIEQKDIPFDLIEKSDGVYITSLSGDASELFPRIAQHAHKHNVMVAANPTKSQLINGAVNLQAALPYVHVFILNESEARLLYTSLQPKKSFTIEEYCNFMLQQGPSIVVVTSGASGVHVAAKENNKIKIYYQKTESVKVVNTVGAGDAFGSCFFGMLMHGATIEKALKCGLMNSASLLTGRDTKEKLLTRAELEN